MSNISREPIQNDVAVAVGSYKAWRIVATDESGNALLVDAISWEIRYDYDTRTDGQPVYVGYAKAGTATATETWLIHKFTYNSDNFVTRRQVATDVAWDDRATSF